MKKQRRIEITTFRRRVTVVLRDKPVGGHIAAPPHQADAPHTVAADSPLAEAAEINQPQVGPLPANSFALIRFMKQLSKPKAEGK